MYGGRRITADWLSLLIRNIPIAKFASTVQSDYYCWRLAATSGAVKAMRRRAAGCCPAVSWLTCGDIPDDVLLQPFPCRKWYVVALSVIAFDGGTRRIVAR